MQPTDGGVEYGSEAEFGCTGVRRVVARGGPQRRGRSSAAGARTRRERTPKLAVDRVLAAAAVTAALGCQPGWLVRTLTWDQGREMARWADLEAALGIEVFFCEPRSPWQWPTNEHTNHMPRRLHHWASAADIYTQLTCNHR